MKIVIDENVPARTVRALCDMGHSVVDWRASSQAGSSDEVLWEYARAERALLITTDKGFARRWSEAHHGILIVRLRQPNRIKIHERVMLALRRFPEADWPGLLVVMRDRAQSVRRARRQM